MNEDRHLLFGAMAMQAGLISSDQLAEACAEWSPTSPRSLPEVLIEKGWLVPQDKAHVDYLVERSLAKVGGDSRESFTRFPAEVRAVLATMADHVDDTVPLQERKTLPAGRKGVHQGDFKPNERYELNSLHAAGGIGEIWLARDADLQRDVAVKKLQAGMSTSEVTKMRFLREARITGQLDHPGVVPVYEICWDQSNQQPYYSMRFLKGRTLTDVVRDFHSRRKANGPDPQKLLTLLNAFSIICNTVAYAHSKGIIHRDLKCENVILGDYGEVVVIDWGLAKEVGSYEVSPPDQGTDQSGTEDLTTTHPLVTLAGHVLGSPSYMAPEQAAGQTDLIGPCTDIYGLCAILYEILCGQPPFLGASAHDVLLKVVSQDPVPPRAIADGVPEALERICLKGLAKSPAERHVSADELAKSVQRWVSDLAERRRAEEERERFFALSLDLLAIIDNGGRLRQTSPAWDCLLEQDRQALVDHSFLDLIHEEDRELVAQRLRAVAENGQPETFEARVLHRDGSLRWISWNVTPIAKEPCVYVVGRDITTLKRSQQLFEGILQSAPDAMILVDPTGKIVMVNRQTERVFGHRPEEMLGQPVEMLIPPRFRAQHPANVARFFATSSVRPMGAGLALVGLRKNGDEFPAEIALSPIMTADGPLVAASVRNADDRKKATAK
ncbi:MAG: PAS domain S-box protein [Planctomycetota bacterium]